MPIIQKAMEPGISNAFNLQNAATPELKAIVLAGAIAAAVPSGIFPPNPPTPLIPSGLPLTISKFKDAFSKDMSATPDSVAKGMASAIASLVPTVPTVGESLLKLGIKNALSLDMAATPDAVASIIAASIVAYYSTAGVT